MPGPGSSRIERAVYGSASGRGGFEILAASVGLEQQDLDLISRHANLGGRSSETDQAAGIVSFYQLAKSPESWALSRTIFLESAGRGADYLVDTIVVDRALLEAARWDLQPLDLRIPAGLEKPQAGERLPGHLIELGEAEELSRRRLREGVDARALEVQVAGVLRELARGPVAVQVDDAGHGRALLLSVVASLPPDDRAELAFCTHFSHPRTLPFRLLCFTEANAALVRDNLSAATLGWEHHLVEAVSLQEKRDAFSSWPSVVAGGLDPLAELSLLSDPRTAVLAGHRFVHPVDSPPGDRAADQRLQEQVIDMIIDPRNRYLPSVTERRPWALVQRFRSRVAATFDGTAGEEELSGALAWLREDGEPIDRLLAAAEEPFAGGGDAVGLAAGVLLATGLPPEPRMEWAAARFLTDEAVTASWIRELEELDPAAALEVVAGWLRSGWRTRGASFLDEVAPAVDRLADAKNAVRLVWSALERAADTMPAQQRREWFVGVLRRVWPRATAIKDAFAARLVAREGLLTELDTEPLERLAEPLCRLFADKTRIQLEQADPGSRERLAAALLDPCADALTPTSRGGGGWEMTGSRRERWELIALVAEASAGRLQGEEPRFSVLARLLVESTKLDSRAARPPIGGEVATRRFGAAFLRALNRCPSDLAPLLLRAFHRRLVVGSASSAERRHPFAEEAALEMRRELTRVLVPAVLGPALTPTSASAGGGRL